MIMMKTIVISFLLSCSFSLLVMPSYGYKSYNYQQPKPKKHTVEGHETLYSISKKYSVTVDDLKGWNNLPSNAISIGQVLFVSGQSSTSSVDIGDESNASTKHLVKPKETLFTLAKLHGVTVDQLKEWNNIGAAGLQAGTTIWVVNPSSSGETADTKPTKPIATTERVNPSKVEKTQQTSVDESTPLATADRPASSINSTLPESVEVKESGNIAIKDDADKMKYLAWHKSAPIGSILKVKNLSNTKEVFVRVAGALESANSDLILQISSIAGKRLDIDKTTFQAEVTYFK